MGEEARFDANRNIALLAGSRVVFHCHHYNVFLQRTLDEALGEDAASVQRSAAAESARVLLAPLFAADGGQPLRARIDRTASLFASLGFGLADTSSLTGDGGIVALRTSHYAIGWRAKFGAARAPVCHFASGFWAGALAAALGIAPERTRADERRCAAVLPPSSAPDLPDAPHRSGVPDADGSCEIWVEVL